jgi:hypothetical protein
MRSEDRADCQPDALERGAGVGTSRIGKAWWGPLPGVWSSLPPGRLRSGLRAAGVELRYRDDRTGHIR